MQIPLKLGIFVLAILGISCTKKLTFIDHNIPAVMLFGDGKQTEGPAMDPEGNLYFSDQPNDVIRKITPAGKVEVALQPSGVANGLAFDRAGRLLICQTNHHNYEGDTTAGKRRIVRVEPDSGITVLADQYNGKPLVGPNDLCTDLQGRIYFTDPYFPNPRVTQTQPFCGVYRIDGAGEITLLIDSLQRPNGILVTPDNTALIVSDRGTQRLHRYMLKPDGTLEHDKVIHDFSPDRGIDGMCMDVDGNIYAAAGQGKTSGVYVLNSETGDIIDFVSFPETVFNVCFGGEDGKSLYVATGGSIYKLHTKIQGLVLPVEL